MLELLRAMLQPNPRDQIKSPTDAAGLLMLDMSVLDQEHLRTVLPDTKNRVQAITTMYVGSVNTAMIRMGEVFKAALAWNSAALIVVHNHQSNLPPAYGFEVEDLPDIGGTEDEKNAQEDHGLNDTE